ncbi:hypothetical protein [Agromyces sp. Soil535]|uniref:hypothetical protein n=1 Tax=Agromyces sp. Soil535 TaxID=1736390 RepID=UPI0012E3A0F4|nr:hypothetical protein [Agromyces sp. Soil535]
MDATQLASEDVLQVAGLPLHPLVVHAVVVLTPLTVLALLLGTFRPAARKRLVLIGDSGARAVWGAPPVRRVAYAKASTGGQAHTRLRSP